MKKTAQGIMILIHKDKYTFYYKGNEYEYALGALLFELISDDALYLMVDKVENMIHCFPDKKQPVIKEYVYDGFNKWLYNTIEDDALPVATELFRSCFKAAMNNTLNNKNIFETWTCIEDFFESCYNNYLQYIEDFRKNAAVFLKYSVGQANTIEINQVNAFTESASKYYTFYTQKRFKKDENGYKYMPISIEYPMQILILEYCILKKNKKSIKQCKNCQRFFVPKKNSANYCYDTSPQNKDKTCNQIGPVIERLNRRKDAYSESGRHERNYRKLYMMIKRKKEAGENPDVYKKYVKDLNDEINTYERMNKKKDDSEGE